MTPRPRILMTAVGFVIILTYLLFLQRQPLRPGSNLAVPVEPVGVSADALEGDIIMPKLGNETAKAELGRAAWKLFHTMMARFPDKPSPDESEALRAYIHLFARLYPCGECALHFREILSTFPPQVSTRSTAAAWACHVHNEVNKSLKKPSFDCSNIGDFYDCGCGDEEGDQVAKGEKSEMDDKTMAKLVDSGRESRSGTTKPVQIEKEGLTRGG